MEGLVSALPDGLPLRALLEVLLAISLSAAAGFRVFVPLLVISLAAVVGHFDLPGHLDWMETTPAVILLGTACLLEIGGYYIPWFDHALDTIASPAAVIAGTLVAGSLAPDGMGPAAQWTLAFVAGGGTAGLTKTLMNILRIGSTATSGGWANPILSTLELLAATGLSVLAVTVPALAGVLVLGLVGWAGVKIWQVVGRLRSPSRLPGEPGESPSKLPMGSPAVETSPADGIGR